MESRYTLRRSTILLVVAMALFVGAGVAVAQPEPDPDPLAASLGLSNNPIVAGDEMKITVTSNQEANLGLGVCRLKESDGSVSDTSEPAPKDNCLPIGDPDRPGLWQPIGHQESSFELEVDWTAVAANYPGYTIGVQGFAVLAGVSVARDFEDLVINAPGGPFEDVPADHLFVRDIVWLAAEGITRGCNPPDNTRFCPDDFVTRGQMAAFLVRALGLADDGGGDLFIDDDDSVFEGDIDRLATAGITRGCNPPTNDRFCPDDFVTRGQMAAFLNRALSG